MPSFFSDGGLFGGLTLSLLPLSSFVFLIGNPSANGSLSVNIALSNSFAIRSGNIGNSRLLTVSNRSASSTSSSVSSIARNIIFRFLFASVCVSHIFASKSADSATVSNSSIVNFRKHRSTSSILVETSILLETSIFSFEPSIYFKPPSVDIFTLVACYYGDKLFLEFRQGQV